MFVLRTQNVLSTHLTKHVGWIFALVTITFSSIHLKNQIITGNLKDTDKKWTYFSLYGFSYKCPKLCTNKYNNIHSIQVSLRLLLCSLATELCWRRNSPYIPSVCDVSTDDYFSSSVNVSQSSWNSYLTHRMIYMIVLRVILSSYTATWCLYDPNI